MNLYRLLIAVTVPPVLLGVLLWSGNATKLKKDVKLYDHMRQVDMDEDEAMFVLENALNCERAVVMIYGRWDLTAILTLKHLNLIQEELSEYPAARGVLMHLVSISNGRIVSKINDRLDKKMRAEGGHSFLFFERGELLGQESTFFTKDDPGRFLSLFDKYYGEHKSTIGE